MKDWIDDNLLTIVGIVVAIIALIIPIYKYLFDRKLQLQDARFKIYHGLIKSLVEPELQEENVIDEKTGLVCNKYGKMEDRQIATIFELRNFPEYFEITERILRKLKVQWEANPNNVHIINEIRYTLSYITTYQKWIYKFLRWTIILSPVTKWFVNTEIQRVKY